MGWYARLKVVVEIILPLVGSMADCELDVGAAGLELVVSHQYKLELIFPRRVDDDKAAAKFVRKSKTLRITAPVATACAC